MDEEINNDNNDNEKIKLDSYTITGRINSYDSINNQTNSNYWSDPGPLQLHSPKENSGGLEQVEHQEKQEYLHYDARKQQHQFNNSEKKHQPIKKEYYSDNNNLSHLDKETISKYINSCKEANRAASNKQGFEMKWMEFQLKKQQSSNSSVSSSNNSTTKSSPTLYRGKSVDNDNNFEPLDDAQLTLNIGHVVSKRDKQKVDVSVNPITLQNSLQTLSYQDLSSEDHTEDFQMSNYKGNKSLPKDIDKIHVHEKSNSTLNDKDFFKNKQNSLGSNNNDNETINQTVLKSQHPLVPKWASEKHIAVDENWDEKVMKTFENDKSQSKVTVDDSFTRKMRENQGLEIAVGNRIKKITHDQLPPVLSFKDFAKVLAKSKEDDENILN